MAAKKLIDFDLLDDLCALQCTGEECAAIFKIDYDTLNARVKEETGLSFSDYFKQKRVAGKVSLRRSQFLLAKSNPAMAIFLGKNILDQTDKTETINTNLNTDIQLSPEERAKRIEELKAKL